MGERNVAYRVFVGETRGRLLGRLRRRWENNIKIDLYTVGEGRGLDRCSSVQGEISNTCK